MSAKVASRKKTKADERWLPISGYEGLYEVSDHGRVKSLPRETISGILGGKILAFDRSKKGYCRVTLSRDGVAKRFLVHRLVLVAFEGEPSCGQESCHNDSDPSNNFLINLRWDTRSENAFDRVRNGTHVDNAGEKHPNAKLNPALGVQIFAMRRNGALLSEIAAETRLSIGTISNAVRGKSWIGQLGGSHA